jgi:hypothetical protein
MAAAAAAKLAPQIIGLLTGGKARGGAGENAPSIGQARFEFQGLKEGAGAVVNMTAKVTAFLNPAHQFAEALGLVTDTFTTSVGLLTEPLAAVTDSFKGMHDAVAAVGASAAEFVKYADPAAVQRWEFAVKDGMAAIGHAIAPLTMFGEAFSRAFADLTAAAAPAISAGLTRALQPLIEGLPKLVDTAGPLVRLVGQGADVFGKFGEVITRFLTKQEVVDAMSAAFGALETASQPFLATLELLVGLLANGALRLADWVKQINELFGIGTAKSKTRIAGGSVGLAATNARVGSVESFYNEALARAFQVGNKPADPAVRTAGALERMQAWLSEGGLSEVIAQQLQKATKEIVDGIVAAIPGAGAARAVGAGDLPGAAKALGLPKGAVDAIREGGAALDGLRARADEWMRDVGFWRP